MMRSILLAAVVIAGFGTASTKEAGAVVYCSYVGYPAGCARCTRNGDTRYGDKPGRSGQPRRTSLEHFPAVLDQPHPFVPAKAGTQNPERGCPGFPLARE